MAGILLPLMLATSLLQGVYSFSVTVKPGELIVKEGDPIEMVCHTNVQIDFCRIQLPSEESFVISPNKKLQGMSYFGEGFQKGDCGIRINAAREIHNGEFTCALTGAEVSKEVLGKMNLTIAKTPSRPELRVTPPSAGGDSYKEGEILSASCTVRNGRPAANVSWYIGDDKITDGVGLPFLIDIKPSDLQSIELNITRRIQASDNGKPLKCVAQHPLLNERQNTTTKIIYVKFPPKETSQPLERFGLVEGEEGRISVTVQANPQPVFTWMVDGQPLHEGDHDESGRLHSLPATATPNIGQGSWDSVLIINPLTKEDVERNYQLVAKNNLGEETYKVIISTSPEPKMLELGAGAIVGIVVAVLVLLTFAAVLLFARAKGRWCFAGGVSKGEKDAQNPEKHQPDGNDNPAANHNAQFISDSPDLKKPKEDTPV